MDTWQGKASNPTTLNKYLYAEANPVMYVDPTGNMSLGGLMTGMQMQSSLMSASRYAVTLLKTYQKVETLVGFYNTAQVIKSVFNQSSVSPRQVALSRTGISKRDINMQEAIQSASFNIPRGIVTGVYSDWHKGYLSTARNAKPKAFNIYMPMLNPTGVAGSTFSIPTGTKVRFGKDKIPIKLKLGLSRSDKYGGTLIGFGIQMKGERQLMRVDYHEYNTGHGGTSGVKGNEVAVWRDRSFHYHVMKW